MTETMSKNKQRKVKLVEEIKEHFEKSQSVIIADYRGLNVAEMEALRKDLREQNVTLRVLKNTLAWRAAQQLGWDDLEEIFKGPTAVAFGVEDAVAPAKVMTKFAKDNQNLELKAGVLEGKVISLEEVKALADLPSREELLAKVLGCLQTPLVNMANVLQAPIRDLVQVTDALRNQKAAEA